MATTHVPIPAQRHVLGPRVEIERHIHARPYAAVVLRGGYEEAGEAGRFVVAPGDVLVHAAFSGHVDRTCGTTEVLNLALDHRLVPMSLRGRIGDPDRIVRMAERDPRRAARELVRGLVPLDDGQTDELDRLARALVGGSASSLATIARRGEVGRHTLWRSFVRVYGIAPSRYRVEARARRAWGRIVAGDEPLSAIAIDEGFADQAHMTRDVRGLTGAPPGAWRRIRADPFATGD